MPRALWKGSISFGLVNIPIELHTAVRDSRPHFRMLHAKDKWPVRFERVCIRDGQPVAWEDLVKGYEYEKGRFVVLTKDDFKAKGKRVRLEAGEEPRRAEVVDLMERLRRSLAQSAPAHARDGRRKTSVRAGTAKPKHAAGKPSAKRRSRAA